MHPASDIPDPDGQHHQHALDDSDYFGSCRRHAFARYEQIQSRKIKEFSCEVLKFGIIFLLYALVSP
jgi:hypothetical protein